MPKQIYVSNIQVMNPDKLKRIGSQDHVAHDQFTPDIFPPR